MKYEDDGFGGRRISREYVRSRIVDKESGGELHGSIERESVENWDGSIEHRQISSTIILDCGHPHRPDQYAGKCEICSKKRKRTVWVCYKCHVQCAYCGLAVCIRCTRPGLDGVRYCSKRCLRKALKDRKRWASALDPSVESRPPAALGAEPPSPGTAPPPVRGEAGRGLLRRLAEWW